MGMQLELMKEKRDRLSNELRKLNIWIEEAQNRSDRSKVFGEDSYPTGTIIKFLYRFPDQYRREAYEYAVLKCSNGLWYTTGPKSPKAFSWEDLVRWWLEGETTEFRILHSALGARKYAWDTCRED